MTSQPTSRFSWLRQFFSSRMPIADVVSLQQRSTYILPTKPGLFLATVILLMLIGATNYQNNLAFMLTFLTASIGLVSILFTFKNLQGLRFRKGACESVCAGDMLHIKILVESQQNQSHSAVAIGVSKLDLYYFDVHPEQRNEIEIAVPTEKRGWFNLPRLVTTTQFPFGLLQAWAWFKFESPVLIYPKPLAPPSIDGAAQTSDDEQDELAKGSEELYGLKTYQPGEPISRIDWKAMAREKGLFSKEFVDYQSDDTIFSWHDYANYPTESILSFLCYLVIEASKNNQEFGLQLPDQNFSPSSGEQHLKVCLAALASYGLEV